MDLECRFLDSRSGVHSTGLFCCSDLKKITVMLMISLDISAGKEWQRNEFSFVSMALECCIGICADIFKMSKNET